MLGCDVYFVMRIDVEQADRIAEWRKRAERLRALAKITRRAADRAQLTDLAKQWEGMAARVERTLRQRIGPNL